MLCLWTLFSCLFKIFRKKSLQYSSIEVTLPDSGHEKFPIPSFLSAVLKKFQRRLGVHRYGPEVIAKATEPHNGWAGSEAVVSRSLILDEATRPTRSQHASTITQVGNGDLLAAWFGGLWEKHPDTGIWMSRYKDGRWGEPMQAAWPLYGEPCWNPVLVHLRDPDETLLFYKVGNNSETWSPRLMRSYDNGFTWTRPEGLPQSIMGPAKNKPLVLDDGTIIVGSSVESKGWTVHIEYSKDRGITWKRLEPIEYERAGIIQPALFKTRGGLGMVARSRDRFLVEASADQIGQKWSKARLMAIPNPNSGVDTVTLHDGRVLLAYNPLQKGRFRLAIAVRDDGAAEFKPKILLEDTDVAMVLPPECQDPSRPSSLPPEAHRPEYSYPAIIQSSDGLVHVTYTYSYNGRGKHCCGRENIMHVVIDPSRI